jgi:hypothetical protein
MIVESVFAQSITKPSVPEFNAKLISSPPQSQLVNRTIELSIKNQPSVSFYNIRMRIDDGSWSLLYPNSNSVPNQSNDEYTILSYSSGYLGVESQYHLGYKVENLTAGDKIDFQVQAMFGIIHRVLNLNFTRGQYDMYPYVFTGEIGDWSNIQTITIPSSELTPTPSVPEFSSFTIPFLFSIMLATAGLLVYCKRKAKAAYSKKFE